MSDQLDLLLVNPGSRRIAYQSLADDACAVETPIWCGLLAGFVKQYGFTVEVLDANADGLTAVAAAEHVRDLKPRLTAVVCYGQNPSASTQTMPAAVALVAAIKKLDHDRKVMVLGGHVAALPERSLRETGADYACTGEGCYTLVDLLRKMLLEDCRGLVYRQPFGRTDSGEHLGEMLAVTNHAPNVSDLDQDMPGVMWHMLPDPDKYRCHEWQAWATPEFGRSPYAALYTTLGCPFKCSFCCIQAPFNGGDSLTHLQSLSTVVPPQMKPTEPKNSYRYWSPELIGRQIARLYHGHGVRNFKIADEMFVLNRKHVLAVCEAIRTRIKNAHDRINIWAYARVDTCGDNSLLTALRTAGFRWLALGIESAVESVRDGVDKGYRQDRIADCIDRVNAAGIAVGANYIFGLPGDTQETMEATYKLACELNTPYANFYAHLPYPGSRTWDEHLDHHALPWTAFAQFGYDCQPTATATLSSAEVLAFRERAWTEYFRRPEYLWMMTERFGGEAAEQASKVGRQLKFKLLEQPQTVGV